MAKKKEKNVVDTKEINKLLGDFLFSEPETLADGTLKTPRYETGIVMLDRLLNGGLPRGKGIGLGAEWGVGKTTMLIQACGNIVERYDKKVYYLDAEGGASYELISDMGYADLVYNPKTNPNGKFYLLSVKTIQDIAKVLKKVLADDDTAVVVIDSDTSVTDQLLIDDDQLGTGKNDVGANARMWSRVAKPINAILSDSQACLVIVHQARVDLTGFFAKTVASGGNAMKHIVTAEIWGTKRGYIGADYSTNAKESEAIGAYVKLTTKKNRLTKPFAAVHIPVFFGKGVSNKWAYKEWLETHNIVDPVTGEAKPMIERAGSWYMLNLPSGSHKVQGEIKLWPLIDERSDDIVEYVESHGGFELGVADDDE